MTELINGRTPEEIKSNLSYLVRCETCPQNHEYGCDYDKQTEECRTVNDALALIEHLEAKVPRWISVEERLPTEGDVVFGWLEINAGLILVYRDGAFRDLAFEEPTMLVTHWMPLPEPPEVKHD